MASILYITQIHIEPGALKRLAEECQKHRITRPLVVTDTGIKAAGLLQQALDALPGVVCSVFDATPSNPTEAAVRAATALCHENKCDGLIAIGGGSSMDCAKGVAISATHPGPLTTYATMKVSMQWAMASMPVAAVIKGGNPKVKSGSSKATLGTRCQE